MRIEEENIKREKRSKRKLFRRYLFERLFRFSGILSISFALIMLIALLYSIFSKGYSAFYTHYLRVEVNFSKEILFDGNIKSNYTIQEIRNASYNNIIYEAVKGSFKNQNSLDIDSTDFNSFISAIEAANLRNMLLNDPTILGKTIKMDLLVSSNIDMFLKSYLGSGSLLSEEDIREIEFLQSQKLIITKFNTFFFSNSDSRYPELAGIKGAFLGSFYTVMLTIIFSVIISVGAAVYLQEFAPKNRFMRDRKSVV